MKFVLIALAIVVSGCANTPEITITSKECEWAEFIRPTHEEIDRLSDETVGQILRHNELVAVHCEA